MSIVDDVDVEALKEKYPANKKKRHYDDPEKIRQLEKVVKGSVKQKKPSLMKRLTSTFLEDDSKSVGTYVIYDVLIPAAKNMLSDMIVTAVEMTLFGSERRGRYSSGTSRRRDGSLYVNYGNFQKDARREREISRSARARHDFDEIILETRREAEEVLNHMMLLLEEYGQVTVSDLYDLVGIRSNYTDNYYGWTNLHDSRPIRVRDGYLLDLPQPKMLN